MNTRRIGVRRLIAGTAALGLGLTGALALGAPAFADVGPDQPGAPTEGTLTINKYAGAPLGEGETLEDREPLNGVKFTVTPVGLSTDAGCTAIDLTVAAQWDGLDDLFASSPAAPEAPFCLVTVDAEADVTDAGSVVFDLPVGVYFVSETHPGANPIVSSVPDFYVAIPTSATSGADGWTYDVVADPKNQLMEGPTKVIDAEQTDMVVGGEVDWTITVPIPTLNNDELFTTASVRDDLDARLSYASSTLSIGAQDLVEGTDYAVDADGVTWTFTAAGRAKLDAAMGGELTIALTTTVDEVGDGSIPNDDYSSEFNGTTVPGVPTPYTYWGQLSILKTDDSANPLPLKGAEFQVFNTVAGECPADAPATGALAVGTSDAEGVVQWADVDPSDVLGLWIANTDGPADPLPTRDVCVYETVVPAGHTAGAFDALQTIEVGTELTNELPVVNPRKTDRPDLPLTGGAGTLVMSFGGLALVGLGLVALLASRRRKAAL